jgi:hypothetical protein
MHVTDTDRRAYLFTMQGNVMIFAQDYQQKSSVRTKSNKRLLSDFIYVEQTRDQQMKQYVDD